MSRYYSIFSITVTMLTDFNVSDTSNVRSGFHYAGHPLKHNGYVNDYKNVASMQDCLDKCEALPDCRYVNYKSNSKTCFVKTGMGIYTSGDSFHKFGIVRRSKY